ncbi:MAG: ATP-binding protein [Bacteroidetes bacterium]|nr:ATP-binding protein [Bacteroidota bacterium]
MINRKITPKLLDALSDSPVVLLHGARQSGKSTLIKSLTETSSPAKYLTFDDPVIFSAAKSNPIEFLEAYEENLAVDEVQRIPEIFLAIKNIVDKKRKPGKFILTGSSNVLLLPKISESLAGRIEILTLYPFSQSEIESTEKNFIDKIFQKDFKFSNQIGKKNDLFKRITTGGYPEMLSRKEIERQNAWFKSYITTILQRDVRDLANIEKLSDLPKLLKIFASRAGTLLNFAELSRSASLPQTTLRRYSTLLEAVFLSVSLPAYSGNLSKRLIKTPKLYLGDSGLLAHLISLDKAKIYADPLIWGRTFENFILLELIKSVSWSKHNISIYHFRTSSGHEVDFILERSDGSLVGIEVKASSQVNSKMFDSLKVLAEETGRKFLRGFVIYTGNEPVPFAKNLFALPASVLW